MNDNAAKLLALVIVGGVAKALFSEPRPVYQTTVNTPATTED